MDYPLLEQIHSPYDLRQFDLPQLTQVADELRHFLIDSVSQTGGHLSAGLGVIELTIALHYIFDTPHDRLVWDVGHQAYPHKILTGRQAEMANLRQQNGMSGFLKRHESEYDAFGAGHSSTSISAALGMAIAARQQKIEREVIAIIGDASISSGIAFEALNHAGAIDEDIIVILNDNDMSISHSVGAISQYLAKVLSSRFYNNMRDGSHHIMRIFPRLLNWAKRWEEHMKGMVMPSTLFEEMGFTYIGPIDGHNLDTLTTTLTNIKAMKGPRFLHVVTQKGKGFKPAEGNPIAYHGVSPFDPSTGKIRKNSTSATTYTQTFGQWLCDLAQQNSQLVAITPAMCEGSGLVEFSQKYPDRYFDVGIAEQHCLTLAAGMAADGLKPVVAIYSTFMQRAYDQLLHDIALQNLDVTLAVDRAGLVGADGATHGGTFDISFARCIPNLIIMAPSSKKECRLMLQTAFQYKGPAIVRYPRGSGEGEDAEDNLNQLEIGKAKIVRQGEEVVIVVFGSLLFKALQVAKKINATVVDMRFIKPLDNELLLSLAQQYRFMVTIEENVLAGGAGSAVNELMVANQATIKLLNLGLPDTFIHHATQEQQLTSIGLDTIGIETSIKALLDTHYTPSMAVE